MTAEYLTTDLAAARGHRHPGSIRRALESGQLHGIQRVKGGTWLIEAACLDAYLAGAKCHHRAEGRTVVSLRKRVG